MKNRQVETRNRRRDERNERERQRPKTRWGETRSDSNRDLNLIYLGSYSTEIYDHFVSWTHRLI